MRIVAITLLLAGMAEQVARSVQLPTNDVVRVDEFYRLAPVIENKIWPDWSKVPAPLLLITSDAEFTDAKTSTPWVITLMHEHFHQLRDAQPGSFEAMIKLGLARGDTTGM